MVVTSSRSLLPHGRTSSSDRAIAEPTTSKSRFTTGYVIYSLLALLAACVVATVAILVTSHKDLAGSWKVEPAVLLSLISSVYTIALGALFATGVAIAWWRSLAKGTSLRKLHYISAGASPGGYFGALDAGGCARTVVLIAWVVLVARLTVGPFSQRATNVMANLTQRNTKMYIRLADRIHDGWFGTWETFSSRGTRTSQEMFGQSNMTTLNRYRYYCPTNGTCTGTVTGAGFHFRCKSSNTTMDLLDSGNEYKTLFGIDFITDNSTDIPILTVSTKHISSIDENCVAILTAQECNLTTGSVQYPITIESNILRPELDRYLDNPGVVANITTSGDIFPQANQKHLKPVGALRGVFAGTKIFKSNATLRMNSDGTVRNVPQPDNENNIYWPTIYMDTSDAISNSTYKGLAKEKCPLMWQSPMRPMLRYIFDFTFRSAYAIAAQKDDDEHKQEFKARYKGSELIYVTDFVWLGVTVASMVLGIVATLALLWGYWEFHRSVTLSPIETGKALGAHVLQGAAPEQEAEKIVKRIGGDRVTYRGGELMVWNGQAFVSGIGGEKFTASSSLGDGRESDIEMQNSMRRKGDNKNAEGFEHEHGYSTVKLDEDGIDTRSRGR